METRTNAQVAAQVAVESVINERDGYSLDTVVAVLAHGEESGVSDFYLDMVRATL